MKKIFTTLFALLGMTVAVNAQSTVDDIKPMLHSQVIVFDNYTGNGTVDRVKGSLFASNYVLDLNGGSIATNKGSIDLATMSYDNKGTVTPLEYQADNITPAEIEALQAKYGKYGTHINSLRLKDKQDVIAIKPTAGSKIYVFGQGNNKSGTACRVPKFSKSADMSNPLNAGPTGDWTTMNLYVYKFEVPSDFEGETPLYIGTYNGDAFFSYIIVEANEPAGTPSVEVGDLLYDEANKLYYKEIVCTPADFLLDQTDPGSYLGVTDVYYTTDGSEPTTASTKYTEPIKCYKDMTVKFQASFEGEICEGATNEATAEFKFNAPTLTVDGATATIATEYKNATNYYTFGADETVVAGDKFTATTSGTFTAYTEIKNGDYATWKSNPVSKPIYVIDPINEKKVLTITGTAVESDEYDETTGLPIYEAQDAQLLVNGKDNDPCFYLVPDAKFSCIVDAEYQIGEQQVYLQMDKPNLTFKVAEGETVHVKVVVSKNSCKNITSDKVDEKKTYVNVDGTVYGNEDITVENGNIIEFDMEAGIHTFQKYSGTGNIHVSSIEFTPTEGAGIQNVENAEAAKVAPKKVVKNGQIMIGDFNIAGQRVK